MNSTIQPTQPQHFCRAANHLVFAGLFVIPCLNCVVVLR
jgi:hypothetical protein